MRPVPADDITFEPTTTPLAGAAARPVQPVNDVVVLPVHVTNVLPTQSVLGAYAAVLLTVISPGADHATVVAVVGLTATPSMTAVTAAPIGILDEGAGHPVNLNGLVPVRPVQVTGLVALPATLITDLKYVGTLLTLIVMLGELPELPDAVVVCAAPGDLAIGGCTASTGP